MTPTETYLGNDEFERIRSQAAEFAKKLQQCSPEQRAALAADLRQGSNVLTSMPDSELHYRQLIELSPDAVFVQTGGRFRIINPAGMRLFGVENEEQILGRLILDFIYPTDREKVAGRMRQLNEDRVRVPQIEQRIVRLDGSIIDVDSVATPFEYEGLPGALVILRDISERKRAEVVAQQSQEKLRQSEQHYRLLFETMLQGVVYQSADGTIISMNPSAQEILGKAPEDFLGQNSEDTQNDTIREDGSPFPGMEHPAMISLQTGQEIKGVLMGIYNPRRKEYRWINISAVPLFRPGDSTPYQVYTLFDDVTEQRQSEARYRSLFEGMSEGFALHEIICNEQDVPIDYRFLDINPAFERLTGLKREDVLGKTMKSLPQLQNEDPMWLEIYGGVALYGEPVHFENYSPALKQHYEVYAYQPGPRQFAVIFMNITERRLMEDALREMEIQRRLLDFREKERQDIARDLHDGPVQDLSGMIFSAQFTKDALQDPSIQMELEQIIHGMRNVVHDLRGMINEMRPPSLIRFGLAKSIQFHAEDFMDKHPEIKINLALADDSAHLNDLPEQTRLSLFRIYQESLNNIIKHAQATAMKVVLSLDEDNRQVTLEISDNGVGFEVGRQPFEPAASGHFGIIGMRERAEAIGGNFQIRSTPGQGTRVRVEAPLGSAAK